MSAERKPRPLTDEGLSRQRSQLRLALARAKYELKLFDDLDPVQRHRPFRRALIGVLAEAIRELDQSDEGERHLH
jgi:hypothetical protein